jgi:hypothetical protein
LLTAKHFQTQLTKKVREIYICTILTPSKILASVSRLSLDIPLKTSFAVGKILHIVKLTGQHMRHGIHDVNAFLLCCCQQKKFGYI